MRRPHNFLPSELWMLVASSVSTCKYLAHLCISSSRFLHIFRPYLYRNVEIKAVGSQFNASHALELLAHDKLLAKCVVELTLERCPPPGEKHFSVGDDLQSLPSLIHLDALVNMISLKHVALYGPVFRNADEQNDFGRVLGPESNISLEGLMYVADSEDEEFPADRIGDIGGLKKLYWNCATKHAGIEPLWHILSRSLTTLHTISLPFNLSMDYDDRFWSMCFPHLRSLTLGFWVYEYGSGEKDFLDFILAHSNTIEVLDLEYDDYEDDVTMFNESSWTRLQTNSLPHLRSLRGHPSTVMALAHARLHSLNTTLRRLAIGPSGMQEMFNTISSPQIGNGPPVGPLWYVQEIELDLYECARHDVIEIIFQCANCCPAVDVWRGTLPDELDAEILGEAFALFKGLRVVYLREDNILGPEWRRSRCKADEEEEDEGNEDENEDEPGNHSQKNEEETEHEEEPVDESVTEDDSRIESFVHAIASICGSLQNVFIRRTYPITDRWTISRTGNPQVFNLNSQSIEERDLERWWTSQSGEKKALHHWIHTP